jgi:TonB family protein
VTRRSLVVALVFAVPALAQDPPAAPPAADEVPIDELPILSGPDVLEYVEAPYPPDAEAAGIEGVVKVLVELDERGVVVNVEVLEGAGHGFDEAAVEAVRAMRFGPAMTERGPVPVAFEFAYGFTLQVEEPDPEDPPPELPINLEGDVLEMATRKPIAGAVLVVDGTDLTATADENGRFAFRGVPAGPQRVRILHPGHVGIEANVQINEGEAVEWRFWLRAEQYRDNEVVGTYQRDREEITRRTITMDEIRRVPGTFGDPIKVVQTLPGAARPPFGTGLLVIRGSNPEDSGVYVDGVRIPIIYHLTGTTSVLTPDLIGAVDYLPGNYGVQYGRSTGGVVDVQTKDQFQDSRLVWGTDILDSQLYWEGNVGREGKKHGLSVGARRSYIDAFLPLVTGNTGFTLKPRYWDYSAKWVAPSPNGRRFSAFVYGFNDLLRVQAPEGTAQGSDADTQGAFRTEYGTHRFVLRYRQPLGEHWRLDVSPSFGQDTSFFSLGDGFLLANTNNIAQLRAEAPFEPSERFQLVPGVDVIGGLWRFDFRSALRVSDIDDPLAERDPIAFDGRGTALTADTYLKAQLRPLSDPEALLLTAGIRSNTLRYTYGGSIAGDGVKPYTRASFDPRFAMRWRLFEGGVFKAATGLFHQPAQPFESVGLGTEVNLQFERSLSTSVGFEHQATPAVSWELELFHKDLDQLVVQSPGFTGTGTSIFNNDGVGRAYGAELIVRHAPVGRFFGWASYTLSRSERRDYPGDEWYLFDFDQTHIFSAQGGYELPLDLSVSAQVQLVTGNPDQPLDTGVYDVDGDFVNAAALGRWGSVRLPPFFQTSFRVDKLWTFRSWQLDTYVDLLNAVRGVNPEFTVYNHDYTQYAYVRGLPFIPNIGIEARFYP